jgi:hypothetical protein
VLVTQPPSNFLKWGKDVGMWLTKHKRAQPATIGELLDAQLAMGADKPEAVSEQASDEIPQADTDPDHKAPDFEESPVVEVKKPRKKNQ